MPQTPEQLDAIAKAIQKAEGTDRPGTLGARINNPGNLEMGDLGYGVEQGKTKFSSPEEGAAAFRDYLGRALAGKHPKYQQGQSIQSFAQTYTGGDNADSWAKTVAGQLGLTPDQSFTSFFKPRIPSKPLPSPKQVLQDQRFWKLPLQAQKSVMQRIDPRYSALPPEAQTRALDLARVRFSQPSEAIAPHETGFLSGELEKLKSAVFGPETFGGKFAQEMGVEGRFGYTKQANLGPERSTSYPLVDISRLPFVGSEQPGIVKGIKHAVSGLTSPENLALLGGLGELASIPGIAAKTLGQVASGYFAVQQGAGAVQGAKAAIDAHRAGQPDVARQMATEAAVSLVFGGAAAAHAIIPGEGPVERTAPIGSGRPDIIPERPVSESQPQAAPIVAQPEVKTVPPEVLAKPLAEPTKEALQQTIEKSKAGPLISVANVNPNATDTYAGPKREIHFDLVLPKEISQAYFKGDLNLPQKLFPGMDVHPNSRIARLGELFGPVRGATHAAHIEFGSSEEAQQAIQQMQSLQRAPFKEGEAMRRLGIVLTGREEKVVSPVKPSEVPVPNELSPSAPITQDHIDAVKRALPTYDDEDAVRLLKASRASEAPKVPKGLAPEKVEPLPKAPQTLPLAEADQASFFSKSRELLKNEGTLSQELLQANHAKPALLNLMGLEKGTNLKSLLDSEVIQKVGKSETYAFTSKFKQFLHSEEGSLPLPTEAEFHAARKQVAEAAFGQDTPDAERQGELIHRESTGWAARQYANIMWLAHRANIREIDRDPLTFSRKMFEMTKFAFRRPSAFYSMVTAFEHMPLDQRKETFYNFTDYVEGKDSDDPGLREAAQEGLKKLTPQQQIIAKTADSTFLAPLRQVISNLGHGNFEDWHTDYMPRYWDGMDKKEIPTLEERLSRIMSSKRPMEGRKTFLRTRTLGDMTTREVNAHLGLEPITYNPMELYLLKAEEMTKYIAAHDTMSKMQDAGLVHWYKLSEQKTRPAGWSQINDPIFKPRVPKGGGLVEYGNWYAPDKVAKMLNNEFSMGLKGNFIYNNLRRAGNFLNLAQLGLSAYHGAFTGLTAGYSDMALGWKNLFRGDLGAAKQAFLRAPTLGGILPFGDTYYKVGSDVTSEYLDKEHLGRYQTTVDWAEKAGARHMMDPYYRNSQIDAFFRTLSTAPWERLFGDDVSFKGKLSALKQTVGMPLNTMGAFFELTSKPIMEMWVPRIKLGAFHYMLKDILDHAEPGTDELVLKDKAAKAWDSVDNRFGQLVYDNTHWSKVLKDALFLGFRSLGWNAGTFREIFGAGKDFAESLAKLPERKRFEVTDRMAFTFAMVTTHAALAAFAQYMFTGKHPESTKDLVYPRTGRVGPYGEEERLGFPDYMRDMYRVAQAGKGIVSGQGGTDELLDMIRSKLNPVATFLTDVAENRDYSKTEIYNSTGDRWEKAKDLISYIAKSFAPISYRNASKAAEQGLDLPRALAAGLTGIQPAPRYATMSDGVKMASQLAKPFFTQGPMSQEEFAQRSEARRIAQDIAKQDPSAYDNALGAYAGGKITESELDRILKGSLETPIQHAAKPLMGHFDKLYYLYNSGSLTDQERLELYPMLLQSGANYLNKQTDPAKILLWQQKLEEAESKLPKQ